MDLSEFVNLFDKKIDWNGLKETLLDQNLLQELSNILYRISAFLDQNGEIVYINKYFTDILGYDLKDITGRKFTGYFTDKKSIKKFESNWTSIINTPHKLFIQEISVLTKDKRKKIINWHFLSIHHAGKFKTVFSVGEDMTEAVLLEKELRLKCLELEEKNKMLSAVLKKLLDREIQMKQIKEEIDKLK